MTELTAKKMFNILYRTLDSNGFKEDIATFIIGLERNDFFIDSEVAMNQLYTIAQNPARSKYALDLLTEAISTYFDRAKQIPQMYKQRLDNLYQFTAEKPNASLILEDEVSVRRVDITEALNPPELEKLLEMVNLLKEDIDKPDDNGLLTRLILI